MGPGSWFNPFDTEGSEVFSRRHQPSHLSRVRNFIWPRSGLSRAWRYVMHRLARLRASPHALAMGCAVGAFVSFTPFIGLHFALAAIIAYVLRGSVIASALGTTLGNPLTLPFIWVASYNVGALFLGIDMKSHVEIHAPASLFSDGPIAFAAMLWRAVEPVFLPIFIGSIPLGMICAVICYAIVRTTVTQFKKIRKLRATPAM